MKLTTQLIDRIAGLGFGCAGLACSAIAPTLLVSAGIAGGIVGATAIGLAIASRVRHGPESQHALHRIKDAVEKEMRNDPEFNKFPYEQQSEITNALNALTENLEVISLDLSVLADAASKGKFPDIATEIVLRELRTRDPIFSEGSIAELIARKASSAAFRAAVEDADYFKKFEPHLLLKQSEVLGQVLEIVEPLSGELAQLSALVQQINEKLDNGLRVSTIVAVTNLLEINDADDADSIVRELIARYEAAKKAIEAGHRQSNLGPFVEEVQRRISDNLEAGQIGEAVEAGQQALDDLQQQSDAIQQAQMSVIGLTINAARAAGKANTIANLEIRLIELTNPADDQFNAIRAKQDNYFVRGSEKNIRIDLEIAVALSRLSASLAEQPEQHWAAQIDLGEALRRLGDRESNNNRLEESIRVYESALKIIDRKQFPKEWASTQNEIGTALLNAAQREQGISRLEEAANKFRLVLEETDVSLAPDNWANSQKNLGNALQLMGDRSDETLSLHEATTCYQEALKVWSRSSFPYEWAQTHNNLGAALSTIADREQDALQMSKAIQSYQNSLEVFSLEDYPFNWAMTHNNLGYSLTSLGRMKHDIQYLYDAIEAYNNTLTEWTLNKNAVDWALTQNNLGETYAALADITQKAEHYKKSIQYFNNAIKVFNSAGASHYLSYTRSKLSEVELASK